MVRAVLFSVALSGFLIYGIFRLQAIYEEGLPERVVRIDIYTDRIAYRTSSYLTPSQLEIGIKAAKEPPEVVALHDCSRMQDFESVVDVLRSQGFTSFKVELPSDC